MDAVKNDVKRLVKIELVAANKKFRMFAGPHEGAGIIQEEVVEAVQEMNGLCRELNARQVVLHVQPDKSLIGGFIIRIGDLEIDQSILGSMNCLKEKLIWR